MRKLALLSAVLALVGCANTAQNTFVAAETSDTAALTALSTYIASGKSNPTVVKKLVADQAVVDQYLKPDEAVVAAGGALTNDAALTNAVTVLLADATAAGVLNGSK